jgi:hypothetical protein
VSPRILAIIGMMTLVLTGLSGCAAQGPVVRDAPGYYYHGGPPPPLMRRPRYRAPDYWADDRYYGRGPARRGWNGHRGYGPPAVHHPPPAPRRENWSQDRLRQHWEQQWDRLGRPP